MGDINDLPKSHGRGQAKDLVPSERKSIVEMASEIMDTGDGSISYLYSGFAMISLPYKKLETDDEIWERRNGSYALAIHPGVIPDEKGNFVKYGVPYGSRARLIMLYLQTEAVRTRSRTIVLGRSLSDWTQRMGINGRGSSNIAQIKNQSARISACRLTVGFQTESGINGFTHRNIVSGSISFSGNSQSRQGRLWEDTTELSEDFYKSLIEHPLPIKENAIKLINNSAMAMDIYIWLSYRLHFIKTSTLIHRDALHLQFGSVYKEARQFWHHFKDCLRDVLEVYPEAKVEILNDALKLHPSPPAVPTTKFINVGSIETSAVTRERTSGYASLKKPQRPALLLPNKSVDPEIPQLFEA